MGRSRGITGLICVFAAALLAPAAASADRYVVPLTGSDTNDCSLASPCATLVRGVNSSSPGETIHAEDGIYNDGTISLAQGRSIVADHPDHSPGALIDNGLATGVIVPTGGSAGKILGFTIRSSGFAAVIGGSVAMTQNTFDSITSGSYGIQVNDGAAPEISANDFSGPSSVSVARTGIAVNDASPQISGNTFTLVSRAISANGGDLTIAGNTITGAHDAVAGSGFGISIAPGAGPAEAAISANSISAPADAGAHGIIVDGSGGPPTAGATLSRNRVNGMNIGLYVNDTASPVTMSSDLLTNNLIGIKAADNLDNGAGTVSATNLTAVNTTDIELGQADLNLDSSILAGTAPINTVFGTEDCTITYARGPADANTGGCDGFTTNATPGFVSPGDFRLNNNPGNVTNLIDHGNPVLPPYGALDLAGNPRAMVSFVPACPQRDMGAYEYVAEAGPSCTGITASPGALAFGSGVVSTQSPAQTITVINHDVQSLDISDIAVTGADASQFPVAVNCPRNLPPAASCAIEFTFAPTSPGPKTATVSIPNFNGFLPAATATLSGEGTVPSTPPPPPPAKKCKKNQKLKTVKGKKKCVKKKRKHKK
jgi:hypothetical protein